DVAARAFETGLLRPRDSIVHAEAALGIKEARLFEQRRRWIDGRDPTPLAREPARQTAGSRPEVDDVLAVDPDALRREALEERRREAGAMTAVVIGGEPEVRFHIGARCGRDPSLYHVVGWALSPIPRAPCAMSVLGRFTSRACRASGSRRPA